MEGVDSEARSKDDTQSYSDEERYDETDNGKSAHETALEKYKTQSLDVCVASDSANGVADDKLMSSQEAGEEAAEAEDGEILEDGEIDDDEEEEEEQEVKSHDQEERTQSNPLDHGGQEEAETVKVNSQKLESESDGDEEEPTREKRKKDRKRKKRQREKDKKKKFKEDYKRKRKRHEYVDFDKADEEFEHQPKIRRRSPPGPYDSPYESPEEKGRRSPPGPYDSPYRSPPGPYDSPPESPPGPYDSPPEDSDEDDRYGDQNNHRKRPKKSLMGMLDDTYLDPSIVVSEKQDIFQGAVRGRNRGRGKSMKGMPQQPRKKPLLETPRAARPLCKFYKEGKCAKGTQCPFNHDFTPPKKPEICKFYLNSTCNKGRECIYMHGEYPCKFFHTGAQCFGGDSCKFSHDPLTPETYPLLTKILDNEDDDFTEFQPKAPRPSLLGSPPRHVKEAAERMKGGTLPPEQPNMSKKIPSLLDIEVFPPKQSPQKQQNSPNSESASPQPGSMHCRPGFYSETGTSQNNYNNPAVLALGALLKQAASQSPSGRYPFQSPNSQGYNGGEGQQGNTEAEEAELDSSQDTQKLEDEGSQEDQPGIKVEEGLSDEDKRQANFEVPSHLPPKQRELFMRIQQQQREETVHAEKKKEDDEPVDDDDWYSSDEEESGQPKPKLMDMLKNISQPNAQTTQNSNPVTQSEEPAQPKLSDSGSFDILQMLNAIRGQTSTSSTESPGPTSSASKLLESLLPQPSKEAIGKSDPRTAVEKTPPHQPATPDPMEQLPRVPKDGSDLPYKVLTITVVKSLYLPSNLDMSDPRVSNDPRVKRYSSRAGPPKLERQVSNKSSSDSETTEKKSSDHRRTQAISSDSSVSSNPADPRKRPNVKSESPSDPRLSHKDSSVNTAEDLIKKADPRLQRAMTELIQSAAVKHDPRIQKSQSNPAMGLHNLPVRPPVRPGFPMGFPGPPPGVRPMGPGPHMPPGGMPMGPRSSRPPLLRTPIMPDNSFRPRGPRPFVDPRINRQNSNEMHFGPPQGGPRARLQGMSPVREHPTNFGPAQNGPRPRLMGMAPCRDQPGPAPNDPRLRSGIPPNSETSNFPQNPSDPRLRPQGQLNDGKSPVMKLSDPRLERQGGSLDSSSVTRSSDPRLHRQTSQPALSPNTCRLEEGPTDIDNRPLSRLDPRSKARNESDTNVNTESKLGSMIIKKKKFIGQRKGSMEYSSPLGLGSDQPDPTMSGFSSYSRPPPTRQPTNSRLRSGSEHSSGPNQGSNLSASQANEPRGKQANYSNSPNYSGYSSPGPHEQNLCEDEHLELKAALQPPLKDLFKTIDPTASPFC